jgi:hypothetical protein
MERHFDRDIMNHSLIGFAEVASLFDPFPTSGSGHEIEIRHAWTLASAVLLSKDFQQRRF